MAGARVVADMIADWVAKNRDIKKPGRLSGQAGGESCQYGRFDQNLKVVLTIPPKLSKEPPLAF